MGRQIKHQSRTRRANNEGGISQRKDGRWIGSVTVGYKEDGTQKRRCVYGWTRLEVSEKLNKLTNRIISNNYDYIEKNNLGSLMSEWLLIFKKNLVTPRTFENTFRNFKLHIEPKVGGMKIDEVDNMVIQRVLNEMLNEGYGLATVRKVKFIFNQFFDYAVQNKWVTSNPTLLTKVKSFERKIYDSENKYKAIPPDIREKFLLALNGHKFLKPFCLCMMFAGLRTGEALALVWDDIDFNNKKIDVRRGITTIPKFDENGKVKERKTVISDTKTACSVREVPMPDILIQALQDYKIEREITSDIKNINLIAGSSLVFGNDDGTVRTYYGTKKMFYYFLEKNDLNHYGIHFHGLRHTYSNMLFEADQNPKVIQALLGHKSVKTTITTYNSVDKSYFKKAINVLNNQFTNQKEEQDNKIELSNLNDDELNKEIERLLLEKSKRANK